MIKHWRNAVALEEPKDLFELEKLDQHHHVTVVRLGWRR